MVDAFNNFENNIIGEYFYNNSIADNFVNNTIGYDFQFNIINTYVYGTDFTLNYGNITGFSYTATGTSLSGSLYTNVEGTTTGHGVNAYFNIQFLGGGATGVSGSTPNNTWSAHGVI